MIQTILEIFSKDQNRFADIDLIIFVCLLTFNLIWLITTVKVIKSTKSNSFKKLFTVSSNYFIINYSSYFLIAIAILVRLVQLRWRIQENSFSGFDALYALYYGVISFSSIVILILFFMLYKPIVKIIFKFFAK